MVQQDNILFCGRMDRREKRFDQLFAMGTIDVNNSMQHTTVSQLEKLRISENKVWWDYKMLQRYQSAKMIPRGLRLKKQPTTTYEVDFHEEWNAKLSECSFMLMDMLIKREQRKLEELKQEIEGKENDLRGAMTDTDFQSIARNIGEKVKKHEDSFVEIKQRKFSRDLNDYQNNQVYSWHLNRPRSILKTPRSHSTPRRKKNVSFSQSHHLDQESFPTDSDPSNLSDSSLASEASGYSTRSKNGRRGGGEGGGNTIGNGRDPHYRQRKK